MIYGIVVQYNTIGYGCICGYRYTRQLTLTHTHSRQLSLPSFHCKQVPACLAGVI